MTDKCIQATKEMMRYKKCKESQQLTLKLLREKTYWTKADSHKVEMKRNEQTN